MPLPPPATFASARVPASDDRGPRPPRPLIQRRSSTAIAAIAVWVALVVIAVVWGEHVVAVGDRLRIHAPPLAGDYRTRAGWVLLAPVTVAITVVLAGPRFARRASWPAVVTVAMVASIVWAVSLGLNDGWSGLTHPLLPGQYLRTVPKVGDPLVFLSTFTDRLPSYNIHTQGHPPGMVLMLWLLDRVGLGGTGPNLALVLTGGAAAVAAALVAMRDVAGEVHARAAAPFLVLAPAAIWWSSGDALFAGVSAWAVTLIVLATGRSGRGSDRLAWAGGLLFGVSLVLSYGLALLAIVPAVVAVHRRRLRPLALGAGGALLVLGVFLVAGFSWIDGLLATRARYWAGVASRRPYAYFLVGNLAAFALALGPACAVGLARLRDRRAWLLVGGALTVVVAADLSGMSKAEVERIWLPFVPWMLLATSAIGIGRARARTTTLLLAAQGAAAITVQAAVRSPW